MSLTSCKGGKLLSQSLVVRRDATFLHSCKSVPISMKSAIRLVRSFLRYRHLVSRIWLLMSFASWSDGFLSLPDLMEVDRSHGLVLALDLRMDSCIRLVSTLLVNQSAARRWAPEGLYGRNVKLRWPTKRRLQSAHAQTISKQHYHSQQKHNGGG